MNPKPLQPTPPDIFNYEDILPYLKDYIAYRKEKRHSFSLREFSSRVGFRSSGMLSMVLSGKRLLSLDSASRIADALHLKWKERQFLFLLVKKSHAKTAVEKNKLRNEILKTRFRTTKNVLGSKQYRFLSQWYYPVIYILVGEGASSRRVKEFPQFLGRGITEENVFQALEDMCDLGLLEEKAGSFKQCHAHLTTEDDIQEPATFEFLSKMMDLAKEAFDFPPEDREFGAITLEISPKEWPWLKERIREFRQEIVDHFRDAKRPSQVFQLNIQAFPLTMKKFPGETS